MATRRQPLRDVLASQWREVLLGGGLMTILFALFYVATTYLTAYGTSPTGLGMSRAEVLSWGLVASVVLATTTTAAGAWSDRVGRKRMIVAAYVAAVPACLGLFAWLDGGNALAFAVTLAVTLGVYGVAYGPAGAFLPELFSTEHRYSGAGVSYNLGGIVGGAVVPLVAASLGAGAGVTAVGLLLGGIAVLSLASTARLRETVDKRVPLPDTAHTPQRDVAV